MTSKIIDPTPDARPARSPITGSLGASLRTAREAMGVSLRQVSEQTRIQMRYLEAIEADDFKSLPGGIFNRSFVKAYARQVGVGEEQAMEAYTRTAREQGTPADEEMPTSYQPRVYTNGDSTRSPVVNMLLAALILGVFGIGVYALLQWYSRRAAGAGTQAALALAANSPTPAVSSPTPEATPAARELSVQIRAVGEPVALTITPDAASPEVFTLKPSDAARGYTPREQLTLRYAREKASSLEVTINGQRARVPTEGASRTVQMTITPDSYQQLLQ